MSQFGYVPTGKKFKGKMLVDKLTSMSPSGFETTNYNIGSLVNVDEAKPTYIRDGKSFTPSYTINGVVAIKDKDFVLINPLYKYAIYSFIAVAGYFAYKKFKK